MTQHVFTALDTNNTLTGSNTFTGTLTAANLNNTIFVDGTTYTTLASAYAALPSIGGVVVVPHGYSETLSADLVLSKSNSGFWFMGKADIQMGTYRVTKAGGINGIFFQGNVPFGGGGLGFGAQFTYTGTGDAFAIGDASTDTRMFSWNNITVIVSGAAGATGIRCKRVIYFELTNPSIVGNSTAGTFGIVLDGTGNFCGTGRVINPYIPSMGVGIYGTGTSNQGMNAVTILGGTVQSSATNSIGLDIECGAQNEVVSLDLESLATGVKLGALANNNIINVSNEVLTTDVQALSGSAYNKVTVQNNAAIVISNAGTNNHFSRAIDANFDAGTFSNQILSTLGGSTDSIVFKAVSGGTKAIAVQLGNTGNVNCYFGVENNAGGFFGAGANETVVYSPSNKLYIITPELRTNGQIKSTIATGTAPLVVASTTNVANLNASTLSGATFAAPGAIGGTTPSSAAHTTISATGQVTSTLATGTAPLVIASTTPVANLTAVPTTYNHSGTQATAAHVVADTVTLSGGTATVTLTSSAVFTNATSYQCVANSQTGANAVKVDQSTGTPGVTIVFTGTGTDVIHYIAVGN